MIKLTFDIKPSGAEIYFGDETKERCKSPCDFEVERAETNGNVTIKLAGYDDVKQTVSLATSSRVDVELAKKRSGPSKPKPPKPTTPKPPKPPKPNTGSNGTVGDDIENPFAK